MSTLLAFVLPLADPAEEGRNVVLGMLVVGLIFVGVIALGQAVEYLAHRRQARRRPIY